MDLPACVNKGSVASGVTGATALFIIFTFIVPDIDGIEVDIRANTEAIIENTKALAVNDVPGLKTIIEANQEKTNEKLDQIIRILCTQGAEFCPA